MQNKRCSRRYLCAALVAASGLCCPALPWAQATKSASCAAADMRFENTLGASKIRFTLRNSVSPERLTYETMTGGVALIDYNNDGRMDIFLTNGAALPSLEKSGPEYWNRLFRNNGDGTFTDVTEAAGVAGKGYSMGVAVGDYDNDGYDDLYVTGVNWNQLLHNNGDGTFTDVTAKAHVEGFQPDGRKGWSVAAGWFDANNDGRLDLFVVNYLDYDQKTAERCKDQGLAAYCSPVNFLGSTEILYLNNGDGTFSDASKSSHIADVVGKGMGVAFGDYDGDGRMDIFVSNDTLQNFLFHNNGDGTFSEVSVTAGLAYNAFGNAVAGMGVDFQDLDNDGRPDIFETSMFGEGYPVYHNDGDGQFEDRTTSTGIAGFSSRLTAWSANIADFDNDGWKDLFASNADILDNAMLLAHRAYALPNSLYRNCGGMKFADLSTLVGKDFQVASAHRGAAVGDLNNDGAMDIVTTSLNGSPEILMNRNHTGNHWLTLALTGVRSNRDGLGTTVKVVSKNGTQWATAATASGYNSSSDKRVHFGLGTDAMADRVELHWPSGMVQVLEHVTADRIVSVREPEQKQ